LEDLVGDVLGIVEAGSFGQGNGEAYAAAIFQRRDLALHALQEEEDHGRAGGDEDPGGPAYAHKALEQAQVSVSMPVKKGSVFFVETSHGPSSYSSGKRSAPG